jgi:hypothetical protein
MRLRIAEINQDTVAHVPGDEPIEPVDDFGDGAVIGPDDLAQIFGIEPGGECGRTDQIAEHDRQLTAFGSLGGHYRLGYWTGIAAQRGDCGKQFASMPDEADAEVSEVVGRQLRQHRGIDRVVAKRLFVLLHAEAVEPGCDVHARLPDAFTAASVHLTANRG